MPVVGRRTGYRINIIAGDDLAIFVVRLTIAVAVGGVDAFFGRIAARRVDVAYGDYLNFGHFQEVRQVRAVHHLAGADRGDRDLVVGRGILVVAQRPLRNYPGNNQCGRRRFDKRSTRQRGTIFIHKDSPSMVCMTAFFRRDGTKYLADSRIGFQLYS